MSTINNEMKSPIEHDQRGVSAVVDEAIDGSKAIPVVLVTKNEDGEFEYIGGGGGPVDWESIENKPEEFPPEPHIHEIAQVTGLQAALDEKAPTSHTHTIAQVTGLQAELDGKAPTSHTHTIAQVTGLQAALDEKTAKPTAIEPIEDPSTATAEDIANKLNELIAALKA